MAQLTVSLILLISCCFLKGNFQELCEKDARKSQEENRRCTNPCSTTKPCRNTRAKCLCDGACGFICIAPGHTCRPPENLKLGSISAPDGYEFLAEIQYDCDEGYELIGADKRFCQGDSSWSGEEPRCVKEGIRCGPPNFEFPNALLDVWPIKDEYFEGDELSYKCDVGFFDTAGNSHITTCEIDDDEAYWTSISPNCKPKTCPRPENIRNGYYDGTDFAFGKSVEYFCNPGYNLFGANNLLCLGDEWASFPPDCRPVICSKPPNPNKGSVKYEEPLKYRSNAWYECDTGYVLSGDRVRVCGETGEWGGKEPECIIAQCDPPDEPKNGFIRSQTGISVNSRVEYGCDEDTTTSGIMSAICSLDGDTAKWSVPPPICTPNCKVKELENAYITSNGKIIRTGESLRHGSSIVFHCNNGYEIPSTTSWVETTLDAKCDEGRWSRTIECNPARCLKSKISNNKLDERKFKLPRDIRDRVPSGSRTLLDCQEGYPEKDVDSYLICSRGSWSYPEKNNEKCNRRSCDISNFSLQFGKISIGWNEINPKTTKKIAHDVQLKLQCTQLGYELYKNNEFVQNSLNKIVKCSDGRLSSTSFECKPGPCKCSDLKSVVRNKGMGTAHCRTDYYVDNGKKEQLQCLQGFSGPAKLEATCNRKTWVVDVKCIQNCDCSEMGLDKSLKIMRYCTGQAENGKSFTLECAKDYGKFAGKNRVVECKGGKWDVPKAYCEAPCYVPDIKNGAVFIPTGRNFAQVFQNTKIGAGNEVMITCEKGFELVPSLKSTNSRVLCTDGAWTVVPYCRPMYEETTPETAATLTYPRRSTINSHQTTTTEYPVSATEIFTVEPLSAEQSSTIEPSTKNDDCNGSCEEDSYENDNETVDGTVSTEKPEPQKCIYEYNANEKLMAYQDDELLTNDVVLSPAQSLTFRCQDISLQLLVGTNNLVCAENGWQGNIPKCEVLSHRDPNKAPVVTYKIWKGEHYIAPNGSLFISENAQVILDCWWFSNRHGFALWSWNKKRGTEVSQVRTQWTGNGNFELTVDKIKKEHAGVYSCSNPKEQVHGIDIRIIATKIQPTRATTVTTQLPTTSRTWRPLQTIRTTTTVKPTTEITKLPTTTVKEEYRSGECISMKQDDLIIHENGHLLDRPKNQFPPSTSLVFKCRDFFTRKLIGVTKLQCHNGKWSHSWPTCQQIFSHNWYSPPPVSVTSNMGVMPLDNGDYVLPIGADLYFQCFFYHVAPIMYVNNVLVRKDIYLNEDLYSNNVYYYVRVGTVNAAARYTFKCYIPHAVKDEKYSNSITVLVGSYCFFLDEAKVRLTKRFPNAVILPSSLRPIYAEGDIINFGCSKHIDRSSYIPEGIRCNKDGNWDLQRNVQTMCS